MAYTVPQTHIKTLHFLDKEDNSVLQIKYKKINYLGAPVGY